MHEAKWLRRRGKEVAEGDLKGPGAMETFREKKKTQQTAAGGIRTHEPVLGSRTNFLIWRLIIFSGCSRKG